jgi:hypothetical protein
MAVQTDVLGIDLQQTAKHQLCVPAVQIEGSSYRLREHADLLPENVRLKSIAAAPIPPTLKRRGRPPKNGRADHAHG